jgi:preprotein translocase subunit Sec63
MEIRSNDQAFLYVIFSFQAVACLYGTVHLLMLFCSAEKRAISSNSSKIIKFLIFVLLVRWAWLTIDVLKEDQSFTSEWNPYQLLHIDDDGSFNTPEIRQAYKRLSKKYHPDKVNWDKLKGQEDSVHRRWNNLV